MAKQFAAFEKNNKSPQTPDSDTKSAQEGLQTGSGADSEELLTGRATLTWETFSLRQREHLVIKSQVQTKGVMNLEPQAQQGRR